MGSELTGVWRKAYKFPLCSNRMSEMQATCPDNRDRKKNPEMPALWLRPGSSKIENTLLFRRTGRCRGLPNSLASRNFRKRKRNFFAETFRQKRMNSQNPEIKIQKNHLDFQKAKPLKIGLLKKTRNRFFLTFWKLQAEK